MTRNKGLIQGKLSFRIGGGNSFGWENLRRIRVVSKSQLQLVHLRKLYSNDAVADRLQGSMSLGQNGSIWKITFSLCIALEKLFSPDSSENF